MNHREIVNILSAAGLRPRHQLGQNFMIDGNALRSVADAGEVKPGDIVLEVGPGVGNLTRLLAERVAGTEETSGTSPVPRVHTRASTTLVNEHTSVQGAVLAVDIDAQLMAAAKQHHATLTNVTWMHADVLAGKHAVEPRVLQTLRELRAKYPGGEMKLVSNLPYNIASPLVAELLVEMWRGNANLKSQISNLATDNSPPATPLPFTRMAFTVQWEVAQRMIARPDTRDYGPLGILIQSMSDVTIARKIAPGAFWPPPKIQSALVIVTPMPDRIQTIRNAPALQTFLAGIFSHRRQTLANALKHHYGEAWNAQWKTALSDAKFDLSKRPENFPMGELLRLEEACSRLRTD